jgi:energy-coupling factor transport system permease protein
MALTLYVPAATPLHRLHPVTKVAGLLALIIAAFLVDRPLALVPLAVGVVVLLRAAHGLGNIRRVGIMFVMVFVFTLVVWSFFYGGSLAPTRAGFFFGLSTAMRLDTFLAAGILFLTVTRVEEVAYALGRLGVPYTVGFTLTLSFRLVPVFFEAAASVVEAQRCRGFDFARGGIIRRLRSFVPVVVPVLIGALRRADRMAMALELRGFNSGRPRTIHLRARAARRDAVAGLVAGATFVCYVALWASGAGSLAATLTPPSGGP